MKYIGLLLLLGISIVSYLEAGQTIAVAAGGKITVFKAQDDGSLTLLQTVDTNGVAGPMTLSPDNKLLYATTILAPEKGAKKTPAIATFAILANGTLTQKHTAASVWTGGYLSIDSSGKYMAANHYRDGKVGIWPLADDGVYRGAAPRDFELEMKAHAAVFSPDYRFLFVPATGPNKVFQLVFNAEKGSVVPNQPSSAPGPQSEGEARQPRHLVFHPKLDFAYTSNEKLHPGASAWSFDRDKGLLNCIQSIRTLPGDDTTGLSTADLHLSKDGRFLFVSNRDGANKNKPDKGRDAISVFSIDQLTGKLLLVEHYPCEKIPRSFNIGRQGNYLFVSGQGDAKLGVYRIDQATGKLTKLATYDLPGSARWVSVLPANF